MLAAATRASAKSEPTGQIGFRYVGTAAWEIRDEKTVILIDPYVSRIVGPPPPGIPPYRQDAGDTRPVYGWDDVAMPDVAAIDARNTGATVIGMESSANARHMAFPKDN
jgi:L-ascorbate metabolism protein UlaG (beta-lactamase superfamily)